jgi:hypothetical protein
VCVTVQSALSLFMRLRARNFGKDCKYVALVVKIVLVVFQYQQHRLVVKLNTICFFLSCSD